MLRILRNSYVIAGMIVFVLLFLLGIFLLDFSLGETLLASAALTVVGIGTVWWQRNGL